MKKLLTGIMFVGLSAFYVVYHSSQSASQSALEDTANSTAPVTTAPVTATVSDTSPVTVTAVPVAQQSRENGSENEGEGEDSEEGGGSPTTAVVTAPAPLPVQAPTPVPVPVKAPAPVVAPVAVLPKSGYKDGVFTGSVADALYGLIQVKTTIKNGLITDVAFLQYPNDRGHSIEINNYAMPILKQEAIQAQNANVNIVSGATDTSLAFQESFGNTLAQAKS